jgi:hypothetical protein
MRAREQERERDGDECSQVQQKSNCDMTVVQGAERQSFGIRDEAPD